MSKLTVLGVIPRYPPHSQNNIYGKVRMPPVGIISVLSQISKDSRFKEIYAIDENNYVGPCSPRGNPKHKFLQQRKPADIVMFYGGMSNSIPRLYALASWYRKQGAITIAGGSHVDALPKDALASGVDIVVHGEGEETILELADILVDGLDRSKLRAVKGISFLDDKGEWAFTGRRSPVDLEKIQDTDLTLIRYLSKRWSAIPINKGRGCNWKCEFCVVNKQYGSYKASSIERTMRYLVKYSDMGYRSFFFTDDNFAQNIPETIELCKRIGRFKREFRRKINLIVQVRTEVAENDELIEAMRYAGVSMLAIGYESPIDAELKAMKKGVTMKKLVERSRKLSENFILHGMFIFGYPKFKDSKFDSGLTLKERAKKYQRFFKKARLDTIQVLNAVPLPGSELRAKLEAEERILPIEVVGWDKYDGAFLCYDPTPEGLDPYELQSLPRVLMKKRYLGNVVFSSINYGNWMQWAYNFSIGFPIQFCYLYFKMFIKNAIERSKEKDLADWKPLLPRRNVFYESLIATWQRIVRRRRNLAVKTYAGGIVRRWYSLYKKSGYARKIKQLS